jgi:hypothetical protein
MNKGSSFGINIRFVMMAVPKGLKDSARGFNPGFGIKKNCPLPVRRSFGSPGDEGGKAAPERPPIGRAPVPTPDARPSGATFRAHSIQTANPGLKPWAESLSPFGTKHNRPHGTESCSTFQTFVNSVSLADVASRVYQITGLNGAKSALW